jgi:hypothetical protein
MEALAFQVTGVRSTCAFDFTRDGVEAKEVGCQAHKRSLDSTAL